ncbi:hypothetical protein PFISCL1PPCAC_12021, partial [Pristionchus fissidentatus]
MLYTISSCHSFDPLFDASYALCTFNHTTDGCQLLEDLRRVRHFSSSPLMICPLILATIALTSNVIYLLLKYMVWKREERRFQKRDIFLIQRCAISIITICMLYISVYVWISDGIHYTSSAVFLVLSSANFLYIGGTKVAQSLLLYTAVVHPLFYSTVLTVEHCIYIDIVISAIALFQGTLDGLSSAGLLFPSKSIIDCAIDSCQYPLNIAVIMLRLLGFVMITASYCVIMAMRSLRINLLIILLPAVPLMGMLLSLALDPLFNVTSDSKIASLLSSYGIGSVRRSRSTASHLSGRSLNGLAA